MKAFPFHLPRSIATLLCFWFHLSSPFAQELPQFQFHHIGESEGLTSDEFAYYISQDKQGCIWIGNNDGLNRFDGLQVKSIGKDAIWQNGLKETSIQSKAFEDHEGNIWFSTAQRLCKINVNTGCIEPFQLPDPKGGLLNSDYRVFYFSDHSKTLWLRAGAYMFMVDVTDPRQFRRIPHQTGGMWFSVSTSTAHGRIEIWAAPYLNNKGLEHYVMDNTGDWHYEKLWHEFAGIFQEDAAGFTIFQTVKEKDGPLWICSNQGLIAYVPDQAPVVYRPESASKFCCLNGICWAEGQLMVASSSQGLWLFDTQTKEFKTQWTKDGTSNCLSSNYPREIFKDAQGNLWIGYQDAGVDYAVSQLPFRQAKTALNGCNVKTMVADTHQQLWASCEMGSVSRLSLSGEVLQTYGRNHFDDQSVIHLSCDHQGRIWAVTLQSIYRLLPSNRWQKVAEGGGKSLVYLTHLEDGRSLVTTRTGIYRLAGMDLRYELTLCQDIEDYTREAHAAWSFMQMFTDQAGRLYLPYESEELWILLPTHAGFKLQDKIPIHANMYGFYEDTIERKIYLGTAKGIVEINDHGNNDWLLHSSQDYPFHDVYAIHKAGTDLWFSSSNGLWKYSLTRREIEKYQAEDGLPSDKFSFYAGSQTADGKLWFGGKNGLIGFDPKDVHPYEFAPKVQLDEFGVNGTPLSPDVSCGLGIHAYTSLFLEADERTFSFLPKAIGFYQPQLSKIQYRLVGYDEAWTYINNGQQGRYTRVSPGEYTLEIAATNANGSESDVRAYPIHIDSPFYMKVWFKFLIIGVFVLFIGLSLRIYIQWKLHEQEVRLERQHATQEERDRISRELHDDIGHKLGDLISLGETSRYEEDRHLWQANLSKVQYICQDLMSNIREIVWALDNTDETFDEFMYEVRAFFSTYLDEQNVAFNVDFPEPMPTHKLSSQCRRNLFLIVKEALHNVVKHADATSVSLRLKIAGSKVWLEIEDNGRGMNVEEVRRLSGGQGLVNMPQRAQAIQASWDLKSTLGVGTHITVHFRLRNKGLA